MPVVPFTMWKAHRTAISSISYVEQTSMLETFVITASISGEVFVWTLTGIKIGMFGQEKVRRVRVLWWRRCTIQCGAGGAKVTQPLWCPVAPTALVARG